MTTIKRFACSLCGFKFSKEKFMVNHLKFCKEIDDPNERLGANRVEVDSKYCRKNVPKPNILKREQAKIVLTYFNKKKPRPKSKSPESFAFVNCDINLESDSKLEENQVTSDVFNDLDDVKTEQSSDDVDARKSNIDIKTERDIKVGDTVVGNEFNEITVGKVFVSSSPPPKVAFNDTQAENSRVLMTYLKTNTTARSMQYVLRVMTPTGRKLYKCAKCSFTHQSLHSVKLHMKTQKIHRREKVYSATSTPRNQKYTITKLRTTFM